MKLPWLEIGLVLLLVVVNAAFAGSEVALISLREGQLRRLELEGGQGRLVARLARDPNQFLSTIQIGITLAGFLASAAAAVFLAEPAGAALRVPQPGGRSDEAVVLVHRGAGLPDPGRGWSSPPSASPSSARTAGPGGRPGPLRCLDPDPPRRLAALDVDRPAGPPGRGRPGPAARGGDRGGGPRHDRHRHRVPSRAAPDPLRSIELGERRLSDVLVPRRDVVAIPAEARWRRRSRRW